MKNPCSRDCPDRTPGCDCEKRRAWKWQQAQEKEARKREQILGGYQWRISRRKRWISNLRRKG